MIAIRYYLHSKESKKGTHSLYMDVHCDGVVRLRQAVGETLKANQWNPKKEQVTTKHDYHEQVNARLERLALKVQHTFRERMDEGHVPTGADLRLLLRPVREAHKVKRPGIRQTYEAWKNDYLTRKNRGVDIAHRPASLAGYNYTRSFQQVVNALEDFNPGITVHELTPANWDAYLSHLHQKGIEDSTLAGHVKGWRVLLQFAGIPITGHWLKNTYHQAKLLPDLSWQEINQLADFAYPDNTLQEVAHAFVMDCQLALRWDDLSTLAPQHLQQVNTPTYGLVNCVRKRMGKTGGVAFVPIPPLAQKLWDAYSRVPVPLGKRNRKPYLKEYNRLLKLAAEKAGLKRLVTVETFKGGRHTETQVPLHEMISSHMARHTAASRIREASDYETAQLVLGHATAGSTARYAHLDPVKTAERILKAWAYYSKKATP